MKEFIIQIQEKENGNIVKTWDYGTEEFEKQLKEVIEEKMKEKKPSGVLRFFVGAISGFIGETLSEAIDYMIKEITKKPSNEDKGGLHF